MSDTKPITQQGFERLSKTLANGGIPFRVGDVLDGLNALIEKVMPLVEAAASLCPHTTRQECGDDTCLGCPAREIMEEYNAKT